MRARFVGHESGGDVEYGMYAFKRPVEFLWVMKIADRDLGCTAPSHAIDMLRLVEETTYSCAALCRAGNDIAAESAGRTGSKDRHDLTLSQSSCFSN